MYQRISKKLQQILTKTPQGKVPITYENAPSFAQKWNGQVNNYQEQHLVDSPLSTPIGFTEPASLFQNFRSGLKAICIELPGTSFRFGLNHLITSQDQVIYHPGLQFEALPIAQQKLPLRFKKLSGTIAYLSNTAPRHYGHWMRMMLPTLRIYQKYGLLNSIDYFYIGDMPTVPPFIQESLQLLDIPPRKIIHEPCRGDQAIIALTEWAKQANGQVYLDFGSYDFVRNLVNSSIDLSENCCYNPRVYIARGNVQWRKVLNENQVLELLRPYDVEFRVLDNLSIQEQAQIFYHADVIMAPHGSALTNLMFGKKGTKILEIFAHNHLDKTSFALSAYAGMQYFYMKGKQQVSQATAPCYEDIRVDLNLLDSFCKTHLS